MMPPPPNANSCRAAAPSASSHWVASSSAASSFFFSWAAGLVALLTVGRKRGGDDETAAPAAPLTLADRLGPLVERARSGELDTAQQAKLERLLLAHWRDRRDLGAAPVAEAVASLRQDEEAGPLFLQLERWLHRPDSGGDAVDLGELLAPYRGTPDPGGGRG